MSLTSGSKLGLYEILGPLGAGGMGEVYRACDTRLGRDVAVKVLPEAFSQNEEKLARFQREAHLLASVNHPNVATLYGLEEHEGRQFLVMELVEGETLAERIARGPIPVDETIPVFIQIAEGLEAAHEKGVVHRDLKPSNVKIAPDGKPKILDFGLAKGCERQVSDDLSESPTFTKETATGIILGTAAYMSPEQARGENVDKKTDIWAFGCCLYEALTGRPAFGGRTVTDILASVVTAEPEWEGLPPETPFLVERVLKLCLEKDLSERFHDIADARLILQDAASVTPAVERAHLSPWPLRSALLLGLAVLALLAAPWLRTDSPTARPVMRVEIETGALDLWVRSIDFSPDGTKLAYIPVDEDAIYIRYMDSGIAAPLANTQDVSANRPRFSPDGEWVSFNDRRHWKLTRVPVDGGAAVALCDRTPGFARGHD